MSGAGHDQRVDAWIAKLGGGDRQFFQRTRIPSHVPWRLANVADPATVTFFDYVVTTGSLPDSVSGRVVAISGRMLIDVEFTDSVDGGFEQATGRVITRYGSSIESIEVCGADGAHATGSTSEAGLIVVRFADGGVMSLPVGKWERDTATLMDILRLAAGWS